MRRLLRAIVPSVLAGISLVSFVIPAYAGTNGQQIKVYESSNIGSLCVWGYNQDATPSYHCWAAPASIFHTNSYAGFWWKTYDSTPVSLYYYGTDSWGNYLGSNSCYVPEYQSGSDWWTCNSI